MRPDEVLAQLVEDDILEEDADEGVVRITQLYQSHFTDYMNELDDLTVDQLREVITNRQGTPEAARLLDLCNGDTDLIARYFAITDITDRYEFEERLRLLPIIEQFARPAPDDGAPESFTPAHPERLPFLLNVYRRAIVYIWRDDCPPCDQMRDILEEFSEDAAKDIALLAVYGPADPKLLYDQYNVQGGPVTLFVLEGQVDSRLYGAQYASVIESEIETLESL